ncbi:hypothetical protein HanHA300_Chr01g0016681 [Helianthus annuus]|nr:hypothetical protein HanHA300_Chr01g0016681 [Helianthus annuus]KAJ0626806.1 hypothetical protein HanHA89_Chr01g0018191 [Helianthus annuus]KAJ0783153.1 hypothetical protein HanLR1_Chr01g0017111 [Helianthus annuus]
MAGASGDFEQRTQPPDETSNFVECRVICLKSPLAREFLLSCREIRISFRMNHHHLHLQVTKCNRVPTNNH